MLIWNDFDMCSCVELLKLAHTVTHFNVYAARNMGHGVLSSKLEIVILLLNTMSFTDPASQPSISLKEALSDFFDNFENLILDSIRISPLLDGSNGLDTPKLQQLMLIFQHTSGGTQTCADYLDAVELQHVGHKCTGAIDTLTHLYKELERCDRSITDLDPISPSVTNGAQQLQERPWIALARLLSESLEHCPEGPDSHQMRLLLGQTDALRLLCSCSGAPEWHPVDFHVSSTAHGSTQSGVQLDQQATCELCVRLAKAQKAQRLRAISFCYDQERFWHERRRGRFDESEKAPQLQTLDTWLEHQNDCGHRKALQCVLAKWLSRSCGTPWLPSTWDMQSIWLDEKLTDNYLSPYTECAPCLPDSPNGRMNSAFMLRFAILMLRIEFPNIDLTIEDEDHLDDEDLDEQLHEFLQDARIKGAIEKRFKGVLQVCHAWDESLPLEQTFIVNKIFAPLREELRFKWNLDIPDNTDVPSDEPAARTGVSGTVPDRRHSGSQGATSAHTESEFWRMELGGP